MPEPYSTNLDYAITTLRYSLETSSLLGEGSTPTEVRTAIQELQTLFPLVETTAKNWLEYIESLPADDPDAASEQANYAAFFQTHPLPIYLQTEVIKRIARLSSFPQLMGPCPPAADPSIRPNFAVAAEVELPKLACPSFSGDPLRWVEFKDLFDAAVHKNSRLSNVQKFTYLKQMLTASAHSAIANLKVTNDNYAIAMKTLENRFGKPMVIRHSLYNKLKSLRVPTMRIEHLRSTLDAISQATTQLETLEADTDQELLIQLILEKFPPELIGELITRHKLQTPLGTPVPTWTLSELLKSIEALIQEKEEIQQICLYNTTVDNKQLSFQGGTQKRPDMPTPQQPR